MTTEHRQSSSSSSSTRRIIFRFLLLLLLWNNNDNNNNSRWWCATATATAATAVPTRTTILRWRGGAAAPPGRDQHAAVEQRAVPTTTSATKVIIEQAAAALAEGTATVSSQKEDDTTTTTILPAEEPTSEKDDDDDDVEESTTTTTTDDDDDTASTEEEEDESRSEDEELLSSSSTLQQQQRQAQSDQLRALGKTQHDAKDYGAAAQSFAQAARLWENDDDDDDAAPSTATTTTTTTSDYPTLKLHEALCHLKSGHPDQTVAACSTVLDSTTSSTTILPPALRARALLRRAKAWTALEEPALALADARAAAFLGDRTAVALYGQLMRRDESTSTSSTSSSSSETTTTTTMGTTGGWGSSGTGDDTANSMAGAGGLLESLMGAVGGGTAAASSTPSLFPSPANLLGGFLQPAPGGAGTKKDNALIQSVLASLSKRLTDDSTHAMLSGLLHSVTAPQLQSWASLAGVSLPPSTTTSLASFLQSVTPRTIRRTVTWCQRGAYSVQLVRRVGKVLAKYRTMLVTWLFAWWMLAALRRPLPAKSLRRMAAEAACATTPAAAL